MKAFVRTLDEAELVGMAVSCDDYYDKLNKTRHYRSYSRASYAESRESAKTEDEQQVEDKVHCNSRDACDHRSYGFAGFSERSRICLNHRERD